MTCAGHASTHDGIDVRRYYSPRPFPLERALCQGCVSTLNGMGHDFRAWLPDRRTDPERAAKVRVGKLRRGRRFLALSA